MVLTSKNGCIDDKKVYIKTITTIGIFLRISYSYIS